MTTTAALREAGVSSILQTMSSVSVPARRAPPLAADSRTQLSVAWLVRLRWGAVAGQIVAVSLAVFVLEAKVPLIPIAAVLLGTLVSNVAVVWFLARGRAASRGLAGGLLVLDTLLLTAFLHLSGGPSNPFSTLYLVPITLAAVVLEARWTWFLTTLSIACYATLFFWYVPLPELEHVSHGGGGAQPGGATHFQAMWVALAIAAILIATFVMRLATALAEKSVEAAALRERAARSERIAAVTTLAAGAAHELGSPLGTIAVAASELERALAGLADRPELSADARLIRSEVQRCRDVLNRLAADGGELAGEALELFTANELVDEALRKLGPAEKERVVFEKAAPELRLRGPRRALAGSLRSLVRNGLDASQPAGVVTILGTASGSRLHLLVRDVGVGMTPEVLARAGEPFFSTKPPGHGLGLGLFLTRDLCERLGGELRLESRPGGGTAVTVELPLEAHG